MAVASIMIARGAQMGSPSPSMGRGLKMGDDARRSLFPFDAGGRYAITVLGIGPSVNKGEETMAGSVNKVTLIGNLGRDPEVRSTQDGMKIVNLSLATSENWKDRNSGERRERTEWHRVVIFNENLARVAEQYLRKGSKIYVEGQLQTRKWTDQNGQDRYTTEVVLQRYRGELTMLDGRGEGGGGGGYGGGGGFNQDQGYGGGGGGGGGRMGGGAAPVGGPSDLDDEIPF